MLVSEKEAKERGIHQDNSSMYQVLNSEIPRIEPIPEFVVLLQATVPFRNSHQIKTAINLLAKNLDYDSVITGTIVPEEYNPARVIVSTPTGLRMANGTPISQRVTRRQEYPNAWIPTVSIYVFRTSNLDSGSFYGEKVMVMEVEPTIDINTEADFRKAEEWLK